MKRKTTGDGHYAHPKPHIATTQHYLALTLYTLIGFASVALLFLAWTLGAFLFGLMVPFLLALLAPVTLLTVATPPVTLSDAGVTLHPRLWGERFIAWDEVVALRDYPLLPRREAEFERRAFQGRQKYQEAKGIMLVVPGLPLPYRVTGFFAGVRGMGVVGMTNRTHQAYDHLVGRVGQALAHCDERGA